MSSIAINELEAGMVINVNLATTLIQDVYKAVQVSAANVGYEIASSYGNVEATHANIYSSLPDGTIKNARELSYVLVKRTSGVTVGENPITPIAIAWIDSMELVTTNQFIVEVNTAPANGEELIRQGLQSRGLTDFTIRRV